MDVKLYKLYKTEDLNFYNKKTDLSGTNGNKWLFG